MEHSDGKAQLTLLIVPRGGCVLRDTLPSLLYHIIFQHHDEGTLVLLWGKSFVVQGQSKTLASSHTLLFFLVVWLFVCLFVLIWMEGWSCFSTRKMRMLVETFAQMVHFMSKQSQISKTQAKMLLSLPLKCSAAGHGSWDGNNLQVKVHLEDATAEAEENPHNTMWCFHPGDFEGCFSKSDVFPEWRHSCFAVILGFFKTETYTWKDLTFPMTPMKILNPDTPHHLG